MIDQTQGAICLGPKRNLQGYYAFLSLCTGRNTTHSQFTELTTPPRVTRRVIGTVVGSVLVYHGLLHSIEVFEHQARLFFFVHGRAYYPSGDAWGCGKFCELTVGGIPPGAER